MDSLPLFEVDSSELTMLPPMEWIFEICPLPNEPLSVVAGPDDVCGQIEYDCDAHMLSKADDFEAAATDVALVGRSSLCTSAGDESSGTSIGTSFTGVCSESPVGKTKKPATTRSQGLPARFCHNCWRPQSERNRLFVCANYKPGAPKGCRKVQCEMCIGRTQEQTGPRECLHCLGLCGPKAQCATYSRTNGRRKIQLEERRMIKNMEGVVKKILK